MWKLGVVVVLVSLSSTALQADVRLVDSNVVAPREAQALYATFVGTVRDSEGNRLSGATVLVTNTANGLKRETTTNAEGAYSLVNIQPGVYDFRISSGASATFERRGISVRAGDIARVDTQLRTSAVNANPPVADTRQVQVGLHTHGADGRRNALAAVGGADDFTSFISADAGLCALRSGGEPNDSGFTPAVGWRVSGRVLGRTNEAITVRIEWQRLWENGARQPKPRNGTLEATIRLGERFPLDSVTSPAADCSVTGGSLEATVISRPARAGGGGFGGGGGGGRGIGAVAGSGRSVSGSGGAVFGGTETDRLSAAAQELRQSAAKNYQAPVRLAPGAFQAELWLVQTRPDATEQVQLITQPLGGSTSFVFPPVRVASDSGATEVEVFGFLRHTQREDRTGNLSLQVAIGRNLRQPGSRPVESYSASGKVVPWPSSTEVLSFELPVSASEQRLLAGHRFDLRLRITPR